MSDEVLENHFPFIRPVRHVVLVLRDLRKVGLTASKEHRAFSNERVNSDWRAAEGILIALTGPEPVNSLIKSFLCRLFQSCNFQESSVTLKPERAPLKI